MDNNLEGQIMKNRLPLIYIITSIIIVLLVAFWAVVNWSILISLVGLYRNAASSSETNEILINIFMIGVDAVLYLALLLCMFSNFMRTWFERFREFVIVETDCILISDWRGRQTRLPWNAIDKVCIASYGGLVKQPDICIKSGTSLTISGWIERSQELRDVIISQANLNKVETSWWRTCYLR